MSVSTKRLKAENGFETTGFVVSNGLLRVASLETSNISLGDNSNTLSVVNGIVTINSNSGGTLDNVAIGSSTPSSAIFTNLSASSTVSFNTSGSIVMNAGSLGSIDNMTIGLSDPADGSFLNLTSESLAVDGNVQTQSISQGNAFSPTNAVYTPTTGVLVLTIGVHNLDIGDTIYIAPNSLTFTCGLDNNETYHSYPRALGAPNNTGSDPFFGTAVTILAVASSTITVNIGVSSNTSTHTFVAAKPNAILIGALTAKNVIADNIVIPSSGSLTVGSGYTPTNAVYTPTTGQMVITIGTHNLQVGDYIFISQYGLTFTCGLDGNSTLHSYPRGSDVPNLTGKDPTFNKPIVITNVTSTTITVNVGISSDTSTHIFVSAKPYAITVGNVTSRNITTTNLTVNNTTSDDVVVVNQPTYKYHATRKDYVDAVATALAIALGG
jgi:hypothetical protein